MSTRPYIHPVLLDNPEDIDLNNKSPDSDIVIDHTNFITINPLTKAYPHKVCSGFIHHYQLTKIWIK